jgi:predicted RNase H-like HicB family nuclease
MFVVEVEQELDGRWVAEVVAVPGVMVYGETREEAGRLAQVLALRVWAERLENNEAAQEVEGMFVVVG